MSRSLTFKNVAADGTVLFLVVVVATGLFQLLSQTVYYFSVRPLYGGGLLGITVLEAVAAYGAWKMKKWAFALAFAIGLLYVVGVYVSTLVPNTGYTPIYALYGAIDISMRIVIMFFAMEGFRVSPTAGTE